METRNTKQKEVGFAIHGLRAYIKALELANGVRVSKNEFRYEIAQDRLSARIVVSADQTEVEGTNRQLTEWSLLGKQARLGLIGLRSEKEQALQSGDHVQYTLNVISQEAFLSKNGTRVEEKPQSIEEWAKVGREVEKRLFESLNGALEYNCDDAAKTVRAEMLKLGVIRERRAERPASEQA
ncbi:MAG TPA: hypothetical protein V6C81_19465 [Planktothrix sp.]|jgi:hypothetical protein